MKTVGIETGIESGDADLRVEPLRYPQHSSWSGNMFGNVIEAAVQRLDCPDRCHLPRGISVQRQHNPLGQAFDQIDLRFS